MTSSLTDAITDRWVASLEKRGKRADIGRYRQGATRLGISLDEYVRKVKSGLKWCSGHGRWCARSAFGPHARYADGLDSQCREISRARSREYQRQKRAAERGAA